MSTGDGLRGGQATGGRRFTPRGLRTRARLVGAARQVFEKIPFRQARLTDITAAAGVAAGTFYTYFDSKEEIFREVADEVLLELSRAARRDPDNTEGDRDPRHRPRQSPVLPRLPPQRRRGAVDGTARRQRRGDQHVPPQHRAGGGQARRIAGSAGSRSAASATGARPQDDRHRAAHDERPRRLRPPAPVRRSPRRRAARRRRHPGVGAHRRTRAAASRRDPSLLLDR